MKPSLPGERAPSVHALPALSRFARARAWAKESLTARVAAVALGLLGLAALGSSALARGAPLASTALAAPSSSVAEPAPAPSSSFAPMPGLTVVAVDAGAPRAAVVAVRPEQDETRHEPASTRAARATPDDPVDLNTATSDDLRRLPGVGAKRAEAILAVRARLGGRFRQIEDLLKVKGIGRAALRRIRPLVTL